MKKAFLITLIFIFGALCFAETDKEKYTKMVTTFCDKGTCVIFLLSTENAVIPKTAIATIHLLDEYMKIVYTTDSAWNTANYSGCKIYLDKNNNLVIAEKEQS